MYFSHIMNKILSVGLATPQQKGQLENIWNKSIALITAHITLKPAGGSQMNNNKKRLVHLRMGYVRGKK